MDFGSYRAAVTCHGWQMVCRTDVNTDRDAANLFVVRLKRSWEIDCDHCEI
jgi:hypothetical protein